MRKKKRQPLREEQKIQLQNPRGGERKKKRRKKKKWLLVPRRGEVATTRCHGGRPHQKDSTDTKKDHLSRLKEAARIAPIRWLSSHALQVPDFFLPLLFNLVYYSIITLQLNPEFHLTQAQTLFF